MSTTHPTDFNKRLGAAVRKARTVAGMSQEAVGIALGVTFQQVQKYERGVNRVSAETLVKIAGAVGTTSGAMIEAALTVAVGPIETPPTRIQLEAMRAFSALPPLCQRSFINLMKSIANDASEEKAA